MKTLRLFLIDALKHKLNRDIAWTFGSFAVLAVSGVLMNVVIVVFRDAEALGIFNLAYAVYLIGSQIAVMGIHYSVMRYAAYFESDEAERGEMFLSACLLTLLLGLVAGALVYLFSPVLVSVFGSAHVAEAIGYTGFGLMLFPLNKVLIGYLNGLRLMRALAVLQSIRYITVLGFIAVISLSAASFTTAALSFFMAELLTTIAIVAYMAKQRMLTHMRVSRRWIRDHLVFGAKGALGGIFLDMNTRVDVLLLGIFLSERDVGIYSFAAMLIDGVQHTLSMIRVNFNPLLVTTTRDKHWELGRKLVQNAKIYVLAGTVLLSIFIIIGYLIAVYYLIPGKGLEGGLMTLLILLAGYLLISGLSPFDNLLLASGHPGYQTAQNMGVAFVNIALCVLLIPSFGIDGAAFATAASYIVGIAMMLVLSHRLLGWNLLTNKTPSE